MTQLNEMKLNRMTRTLLVSCIVETEVRLGLVNELSPCFKQTAWIDNLAGLAI